MIFNKNNTILLNNCICFVDFRVFFADISDSAFLAFRVSCLAHVTSVQYEPMMCFGDNVMRKVFHQLHFHAVWGGATLWNKPYATADAEYMRIDSHGALVPYYRQDYICRFASYTGQCRQLLERVGNFASKVTA